MSRAPCDVSVRQRFTFLATFSTMEKQVLMALLEVSVCHKRAHPRRCTMRVPSSLSSRRGATLAFIRSSCRMIFVASRLGSAWVSWRRRYGFSDSNRPLGGSSADVLSRFEGGELESAGFGFVSANASGLLLQDSRDRDAPDKAKEAGSGREIEGNASHPTNARFRAALRATWHRPTPVFLCATLAFYLTSIHHMSISNSK